MIDLKGTSRNIWKNEEGTPYCWSKMSGHTYQSECKEVWTWILCNMDIEDLENHNHDDLTTDIVGRMGYTSRYWAWTVTRDVIFDLVELLDLMMA